MILSAYDVGHEHCRISPVKMFFFVLFSGNINLPEYNNGRVMTEENEIRHNIFTATTYVSGYFIRIQI